MRQLLPIVVMLVASPVWAEQAPWANKFFVEQGADTPPTIVKDFGTLAKGTVKTYRFAMTNIYAVPLNLSKNDPSCNCVTLLAYTGKLEPMETGYVEIMINTARVEGKKTVYLPIKFSNTLPTGENYESTAILEIRADVRAEIQMTSGRFEFGTVASGEKSTKTTQLTYFGRQPNWMITKVGYKKELLDVVVTPPTKQGSPYTITATLKDTAPSGLIAEEIVLETNDPATPTLTIAAIGQVEAPFSLVPGDTLRFDKPIMVGMNAEKNVIIRSATKPFTIKKVDGQDKGLTVQLLPVQASKTQVLPVVFSPKEAGAVKQELMITLDTGDTIKLTIIAAAVRGKE